jgi:hypothetical protein
MDAWIAGFAKHNEITCALRRNTERPASDRVVAEIKRRLPEYQAAKGDLAATMCADIYFLLNERAVLSRRHTNDECS